MKERQLLSLKGNYKISYKPYSTSEDWIPHTSEINREKTPFIQSKYTRIEDRQSCSVSSFCVKQRYTFGKFPDFGPNGRLFAFEAWGSELPDSMSCLHVFNFHRLLAWQLFAILSIPFNNSTELPQPACVSKTFPAPVFFAMIMHMRKDRWVHEVIVVRANLLHTPQLLLGPHLRVSASGLTKECLVITYGAILC